MDPNDYRKVPRDDRYDPFGDEEIDEFLNWDQPEDDIVGARLEQLREKQKKRTGKNRIIQENAFPEVEKTADDRRQTAEEPRPVVPEIREPRPVVPEALEEGLKITRLPEESAEKPAVEPGIATERLRFRKSRAAVSDVPILEVKGLSVQFGQVMVLRNLDLTIKRGETVAVIGESGCGKTVLLKTLIGLLTPTLGEVLFDGMDIHSLPEKELTRERTRFGFVFQQAALFDSMTIYENISFPLRQHTDCSEEEMLDVVEQLLAEVGLSDSVLDKKPAELSGGMRKRVGFARALAMEPEIMLYDEPTTGLDPIMSDIINELMLRSKKNHDVGGVVVTHDMVSARKVADRIVMLYPLARLKPHESQILFDGTPREIEHAKDPRVTQFLKGEAGDRFYEL